MATVEARLLSPGGIGRGARPLAPVYGVLLSTWPAASGVLVEDGTAYFAAGITSYDGTHVYALDAETGKPLWDFQSGGAVRTNPMSFAVDGKQRIVSTGGGTMFVFGLE